jgi:hypothetical protein
VLFAVGLLLGIQVPSFIDQYQQRIDAHFREVSINITGFQDTADRLFSGDLESLIAYYRKSNDEVFQRDAASRRLPTWEAALFASKDPAALLST